MSDAGEPAVDPVLGEDIEDATEVVVDREPDADPESVRSALERVAENGVVSREGVGAATGEAAQHVATPENRLEMTENALDAAREAVDPATDLDAVQARLGGFEARYRELEADVDALVARLDDIVERGHSPEDVYDLARSVEDLKWDVRDAHGRIEELGADLESFEAWASDPERRLDELDGDVAHVEESLDGLAAAAEELDAVDGDAGGEIDPAVAWADATLRRGVVALLLSDLRAELSDLRTWAERTGERSMRDGGDGATARAAEVEARIDDLRAREQRLHERLETLARPAWRERFGERIAAFEADLEAFDPPVEWAAVQGVLEDHRTALADGD